MVDIRFFDGNGQDLSKDAERNIERVFFREDFRRVYLDEIGTISYADHVIERYSDAFLAALNVDAIRAANPYIVGGLCQRAHGPGAGAAPDAAELPRGGAERGGGREQDVHPDRGVPAARLRQLGKICSVLETALGVRLDVGGERIFVVDSPAPKSTAPG